LTAFPSHGARDTRCFLLRNELLAYKERDRSFNGALMSKTHPSSSNSRAQFLTKLLAGSIALYTLEFEIGIALLSQFASGDSGRPDMEFWYTTTSDNHFRAIVHSLFR